jgi:anionic cell wall polymer biosynthesis LytR-Cps2A-Psr (LCP) family protein
LKGEIYYRIKGTEISWNQLKKMSENFYTDPLGHVKSMGIPFKKDDGAGAVVSVDMKSESERMKQMIRENNNPIELNYKIDYK